VKTPERLNLLCQQANVPAIDVDLPGKNAPSVISDNRAGAHILTEKLIACAGDADGPTSNRFYFIGGDATDHATSERIAGFKAAMRAHRIDAGRQQIEPSGFSPSEGARTMLGLYAADGAAPAGIFVNSITALEGVAGAIRSLSDETFSATTIACNDWDPFGSMLPLRIMMARQNVERLIEQSFLLLDRFKPRRYPRVLVMPEFPVSLSG
jgi:LacI family transcriptional regulator, fructose operon transcriptional repressor